MGLIEFYDILENERGKGQTDTAIAALPRDEQRGSVDIDTPQPGASH